MQTQPGFDCLAGSDGSLMASKDAHVSCRMCPPKRSRPHCLQALCNWTMKAGGIGLDGSMHPARRYSTASLA